MRDQPHGTLSVAPASSTCSAARPLVWRAQHLFARQFVNTGRMAVANTLHPLRLCQTTGGLSVQNVGVHLGRRHAGLVNDLLRGPVGNCCCWSLAIRLHAAGMQPCAPGRSRTGALRAGAGRRGPCPGARACAGPVRDPSTGHLRQRLPCVWTNLGLVRPDAYVAATGECPRWRHGASRRAPGPAPPWRHHEDHLNLQDADGFYEHLLGRP